MFVWISLANVLWFAYLRQTLIQVFKFHFRAFISPFIILRFINWFFVLPVANVRNCVFRRLSKRINARTNRQIGLFFGKNAGWAVFSGSKEAELLQKDWNEKIVKFGIFRVHPDQFLDEFGQEKKRRNVLHRIPKSFFKTSKHFFKKPAGYFHSGEGICRMPWQRAVIAQESCGRWGQIMRSLGANRAVDSAALYGRFREVVSGGNGEGKNKNPRRCGSPGISSTVRCEDGF